MPHHRQIDVRGQMNIIFEVAIVPKSQKYHVSTFRFACAVIVREYTIHNTISRCNGPIPRLGVVSVF